MQLEANREGATASLRSSRDCLRSSRACRGALLAALLLALLPAAQALGASASSGTRESARKARSRTVRTVEAQEDAPEPPPASTRRIDAYSDVPARGEDEDEPVRRPHRFAEETESLGLLDEPGHGMGTEVLAGLALVDQADGTTAKLFMAGLAFDWQLGRSFAPENELLHRGLWLEASWLYTRTTVGTDWVKVASSYHDLSAALLFGYPFESILVYGKLGPSIFVMPVEMEVQGGSTPFTGFKLGFVYGIGARFSQYFGDSFGLHARLEVERWRRGYLDDTAFLLGAGLAF